MNAKQVFYKRLRQAVQQATEDVKDKAQSEHEYTSRTGSLETKALDVRFSRGGLVGTVFIDDNEVPYARFVHQGTRPHTIFPKEKRALRWAGSGGFVFAKRVNHPGWKGDAFLYRAFRNSERERKAVFGRYTALALEEIANDLRRG